LCLCISVTPEFVLAGIHVRPSEAIEEITALETVQGDIISRMENENILFLGDMNAECSYAPKYKLNVIPIRIGQFRSQFRKFFIKLLLLTERWRKFCKRVFLVLEGYFQ
jgi:hypothetical protein